MLAYMCVLSVVKLVFLFFLLLLPCYDEIKTCIHKGLDLGLEGPGVGLEGWGPGLGLGLEGEALALASKVQALALRVEALVLALRVRPWPWLRRSRRWPWGLRPRSWPWGWGLGLGLEGPGLGLGLGLNILALTTEGSFSYSCTALYLLRCAAKAYAVQRTRERTLKLTDAGGKAPIMCQGQGRPSTLGNILYYIILHYITYYITLRRQPLNILMVSINDANQSLKAKRNLHYTYTT